MNDFLNIIRNKETEAANLFIKNSRALVQGDKVEIARELTDLRVELQEAQKSIDEIRTKLRVKRESTAFGYFMMCLFFATLISLGISYFYI